MNTLAVPETKEPGSTAQVLALGIAGLLSGVILVGVYLWTLPMIQRNQAEELREAVFRVLPGTETIQPYELHDGVLVAFQGGPDDLPEGEAVYAGLDANGNRVGFAVPAAGAGFQDTIGLLYGFDPEAGTIVGLAVLQCLETPGLGDRIISDPTFHGGFAALVVEPEIVGVKDGRDAPNEIDVISGATISSNAVIRTLNESVDHWQPIFSNSAPSAP